MASGRANVIKQLPPHLSDLLHRLSEHGQSFIELYESVKERMEEIASQLGSITIAVKELQNETTIIRRIGGFGVTFGIVLGLGAVFLAGLPSIGVKAAKMATTGCAIAFAGGMSVAATNVVKALCDTNSTVIVKKLGEEFIAFVDQLKNSLEQIKDVSEELKEKSSSLMTPTGTQAERILSETNQLQQFLQQTAELARQCREVTEVTLTMERGMRELLNVISRVIPSHKEDARLRRCMGGSASQCQKTLNELANMRKMLKDFNFL